VEKILVALRVYPGNTKIPTIIYPDKKIELIKESIKQLRASLSQFQYRIILINDGFDEEEVNYILDNTAWDIHAIKNTMGIGNFATFELQIEELLSCCEYHYVYFAEDDYLYKPDFVEKNLEVLKFADYSTGYFHPDYENLLFHKSNLKNKYGTTTCSFWTTQNILQADKEKLFEYRKLGDIGFWMLITCSLTEIICKLLVCIKRPSERWLCIFITRTLVYKIFKYPKSKRRILKPTFPSTSTHAEENYIGIGW